MNPELKDTLNRAWKDDKSAFGFRMLQKMGWKEDSGLGKNGDGITAAIKLSKRDEGLALGAINDSAGNHGWSNTAQSFDDVLNMLKESYGNSKLKKKKDKVKKSSSKTIKIGIKYHKMSAAKDLTTKTDEELSAILGTKRKTTTAATSNINNIIESDPNVESENTVDNTSKSKSKKRKER